MTLRLSSEQREIQSLAREFAQGEIRPRAAEWDSRRELDEDIFGSLGELGFMGMRIPEAYGGLDLDWTTYLLVLEELGWGDAGLALSVAIHNGPVSYLVSQFGDEAQKAHFLPRLASGEALGAFALSEAGAGSDAKALTTVATSEDGGWRLRGRKKWVTNGDRAGLTVVFAATDGEADDSGIAAFLVEGGTPGVVTGKREKTMGLSASETVEVILDEALLPPGALLGEVGRGFEYAMKALEVGRLGVAAQAVGIARAAFEHAREYAGERVQFGQTLAAFQATQFKLADMATRIEGARALTHGAAIALESGTDPGEPSAGAQAAMAKATASEASVWIADEAVQIFGGYGYMRHYPVEKLLRDAKGTEIYEGTNEIMRLVVARDVLRGAIANR